MSMNKQEHHGDMSRADAAKNENKENVIMFIGSCYVI